MQNNKGREFDSEKENIEFMYVLFMDEWCGSCRDAEYILKEVEGSGVPVFKVDVAENTDLMEKYSIEQIPTVIIFLKGEIYDYLAGLYPKQRYLTPLRYFLS